jgi:hypothetical protein
MYVSDVLFILHVKQSIRSVFIHRITRIYRHLKFINCLPVIMDTATIIITKMINLDIFIRNGRAICSYLCMAYHTLSSVDETLIKLTNLNIDRVRLIVQYKFLSAQPLSLSLSLSLFLLLLYLLNFFYVCFIRFFIVYF